MGEIQIVEIEVTPALFSLAQPFHGWEWAVRIVSPIFIGLPVTLKLKRETKPDESGSNTGVAGVTAAIEGVSKLSPRVGNQIITGRIRNHGEVCNLCCQWA